MAAVMIGVDPHKGSHTAVAIGAAEEPLGQVRVQACPAQAERLLAWAAAWPQRTWAVEGAGGLGHLLARQLEAAEPRGAAGMARWVLAAQFLTDLRRIDAQRRDVQRKLAAAVQASGTTVTEVFGAGPAVAAAVIGDTGDISRFASKDHF